MVKAKCDTAAARSLPALFPVQQRPIGRFLPAPDSPAHIAVGQHRAFRYARRTAGIVAGESQIFSDNPGLTYCIR